MFRKGDAPTIKSIKRYKCEEYILMTPLLALKLSIHEHCTTILHFGFNYLCRRNKNWSCYEFGGMYKNASMI